MKYEYAVVPAPSKVKRMKGVTTPGERLAVAMEEAIGDMAVDGWEYQRTDTLTVMDKPGRFSKPIETIQTVLVFRRAALTKSSTSSILNNIEPSIDAPATPTKPAAAPSVEPSQRKVEMRNEANRSEPTLSAEPKTGTNGASAKSGEPEFHERRKTGSE